MNENIESKVFPGLLLHKIIRPSGLEPERDEISNPDEPLQLAVLNMCEGRTFKPHKHNHCEKTTTTTQESWIVIRGKVKVILYDVDDSIIAERILEPGEASITYRGGHNYLILQSDTLVYEYKTGPYFGQAQDKTFIKG